MVAMGENDANALVGRRGRSIEVGRREKVRLARARVGLDMKVVGKTGVKARFVVGAGRQKRGGDWGRNEGRGRLAGHEVGSARAWAFVGVLSEGRG